MLIGYSQPAISGAVGITGGTWLTADGGAACFDGKPGRKARLSWSAGGSTSNYASIAATFAAATPLRILAILGLTCPVGVKVDFLGPGAAFLGGGRTIAMPDGTQGLWLVATDDGVADGSVEVRIYNDANGSAWATGGTVLDIGEVVAMPAVDVPIDVGWTMPLVDPSETENNRGSQPNTVMRSAYRQLNCTFSMQGSGAATVRDGGLANGMDWGKLSAALAGKRRCAAIALKSTAERVNSTAIYGMAEEIGETQHVRGQFFRKPMVFREIPAG